MSGACVRLAKGGKILKINKYILNYNTIIKMHTNILLFLINSCKHT